ncbi:aminoglycoside phosphotransferase family protein [Microlunatus sp. Gsoil 973]|uniref:aminoglycoside phosphotransferase family protein n=1 Tax=Microlunatus sp. Gsoil 973 TaxID=2672569 RepID=UPI002103F989|nr:aminoglycoside phosphotransferase family protein [Microlunatus sp. Gsoil 973]
MCAAREEDVLQDLVGSDGAITEAANGVAARFGLGRVTHLSALPGAGGRNVLIETEEEPWVLRLGLSPATLGGVSSGLPTGLDVLRSERFFAAAVREKTALRSPWPYEIDDARDLIPVPYAIMPHLAGTTLGWAEDHDWGAVGTALAEAALELHRQSWPAAGNWDPATNDILPSENDPATRCRALVLDLIDRTAMTSEPLDSSSTEWLSERLVHLYAEPVKDACLVHGDFVIGNLRMAEVHRTWSVTGIFDFENARIGDPEEDLVVHMWWACYGRRPEAAVSFLRRYQRDGPVSTRIYGYVLASLLGNWEYGRRMNFLWYGDARTFLDWAGPLYDDFDRVVAAAVG